MSKYETYKPSGHIGIGDVPEQWEVKRVKNVAAIINGYSFNSDLFGDEGIAVIKIGDVKPIIDLEDVKRIIVKDISDYSQFIVRKGDYLLALTGATIGKTSEYLLDELALLNQRVAILRPLHSVKRKFLKYVIDSPKFLEFIDFECYGGAQENIGKGELGGYYVAIPSVAEQLTIANYLDDQTQKIDRLIANKKAQAEKLKELRQIEINNAVTKGLNPNAEMKDSGIDWLGKIPKHWAVKRVKSICKIVNGSTPSSSIESYWDGDIIWVTPGDFKNFEHTIGDSDSKITDEGYKNCGTSLVPIGSIILTTRAPIGNVLIASKELCTNQGCKSLIPFRINSEFLYYYVSVSSIQLNVLGQGTTFLELSTGNLSTFKVPLPPKAEQEVIAKHLQERTTAIDKLVKNIDVQIEKLQELRKIKIFEAVTGKIKVNAYVEATA